jgi:beta-galactosidase
MSISRRTFLRAGATAYLGCIAAPSLLASAVQAFLPESSATTTCLLDKDWAYYRGSLVPWQVWRSQEIGVWESVTVPHCFNHYDACDPDVPAYRGPGWYRRDLCVENPFPGGRVLLQFEGAGQQTDVYIEDQLVGHHVGGYDEFVFDITEACSGKSHVQLSVLCDNGRDVERMPSDLSDFMLYGGLYRPVHLLYVPAISFEAVHSKVEYDVGGAAKVHVTGRLYAPESHGERASFRIRIYDPKQQTIHQERISKVQWSGEAELTSFEIAQPELWSPQSPLLYCCEVILESTDGNVMHSHRFGIWHTRFEQYGPFYLNGKRLLLKGTQRHEDHAEYAAAMPDDLIRKEMRLIKEMGANFVRLAHYQQSQLVLDLCDELGLFVWEELPWCRSGVGSEKFKEMGRRLLRTMIDQHRNHPSILMWGLGNEDDWPTEWHGDDREAIRSYMKELHDIAHQEDSTRFTSFRRCDFARDIPDVYSPSIWAGWYSGRYTEYRDALEQARKKVPYFLHVEWGADSHAGRHREDEDPAVDHVASGHGTAEEGFAYKPEGGSPRMSKDGDWSESYACDLFEWYLKTIEEVPWLAGVAQWIFKDFTTPLRVENPVPRINQKGVLTRDMTPKESYYVFQSYWSDKPMLRLYGHNWPVRWGRAGQQRRVRVYSNCEAVELFLNGESVGVRRRDPTDYPCAGLRWDIAFQVGENELRAVGRGIGISLEDSVKFFYETRQWGTPAQLSLLLVRSDQGKSTVRAELLDAQGVTCLDSREVIQFTLAGPGRLIDNLGTPEGSRTVQMCNGHSEISLEHRGAVVVGVSMEGVASAYLTVKT